MFMLKQLIIKELEDLLDKIKSDSCELTEEDSMDILSIIAKESLSKDQACGFLNLSRSRFDELIREGKIPKGKKKRGFKELFWYKSDLIKAIK